MKRIALAAAAALLIAGCASSGPTTAPAATGTPAASVPATFAPNTAPPEPTATPEPTPEPTPTPPALVPLGTAAQAGAWEIKVTGKVNFDAWPVVKAANMFNEAPPKGWKMVLVPLAVTNRGTEATTMLGEQGYVIGDGTGVERSDFDDPSCGVIPKPLDAFATIRPGGTLKGNLCFVVDDADLASLRLGWPAGLFTDAPDVEFALR